MFRLLCFVISGFSEIDLITFNYYFNNNSFAYHKTKLMKNHPISMIKVYTIRILMHFSFF
jgi:hypothetical protein